MDIQSRLKDIEVVLECFLMILRTNVTDKF